MKKLVIIFAVSASTDMIVIILQGQPINYETQKIIDLVEAISDKINKAIVNSYLK